MPAYGNPAWSRRYPLIHLHPQVSSARENRALELEPCRRRRGALLVAAHAVRRAQSAPLATALLSSIAGSKATALVPSPSFGFYQAVPITSQEIVSFFIWRRCLSLPCTAMAHPLALPAKKAIDLAVTLSVRIDISHCWQCVLGPTNAPTQLPFYQQ